MRPGQIDRRTHDYRRQGTTSLFAAFDVKTGTAGPGPPTCAGSVWNAVKQLGGLHHPGEASRTRRSGYVPARERPLPTVRAFAGASGPTAGVDGLFRGTGSPRGAGDRHGARSAPIFFAMWTRTTSSAPLKDMGEVAGMLSSPRATTSLGSLRAYCVTVARFFGSSAVRPPAPRTAHTHPVESLGTETRGRSLTPPASARASGTDRCRPAGFGRR